MPEFDAKKSAAHVGGGAALATALTLGLPAALDYFDKQDERESEAHASHIQTLGMQLEKCEIARQGCMDRLLECVSVPIDAELEELPPSAWDLVE